MTKKDYIKFASLLNEHLNQIQDPNVHTRLAFDSLVSHLCRVFQEDNDRFNNQRFRDAVYK